MKVQKQIPLTYPLLSLWDSYEVLHLMMFITHILPT